MFSTVLILAIIFSMNFISLQILHGKNFVCNIFDVAFLIHYILAFSILVKNMIFSKIQPKLECHLINEAKQVTPFFSVKNLTLNPSNRKPRIRHGNNARINEFPYTVFIIGDHRNYISYCGGSILSSKVIITAAHCFALHST